MATAHTDIAVFDTGSLLFARLVPAHPRPKVAILRSYRLPAGTFGTATLTPSLENPGALAEAVGRMKLDGGRVERVSVLFPDSWFRINLVEVGNLPRRHHEADEVVNWTLKRTTPFNPAELRTAWMPLPTKASGGATRVLVVSALEKTLAAVETVFREAGVLVGMMESSGLNVWNAISTAESPTDARLLVYLRDEDFTTALFKGVEPLFIRSRSLSGERQVEQEIRLSASYLRPTVEKNPVGRCYVAGDGQVTRSVLDTIAEEFNAEVEVLSGSKFADLSGIDGAQHLDAEVIACRGVVTP